MSPEEQARQIIDQKLTTTGWIVQDMKTLNLSASLGVAVREYPTDTGPADYVLFIDRTPVGVIEAKKASEGERLTTAEEQSQRYAQSQLKWVAEHQVLRFVYESTDVLIRFTDYQDPQPRSREVFHFHRPETLQAWLRQNASLRGRLQQIPELPTAGLRDCQVNAIGNLEQSFAQARPRAVVQMATGAGKTFTAITASYRLLKYAQAKRILFLVDTRNLGEQAEQEFQAFKPTDDARTFAELYGVQRLRSAFVDPASQVCISTIQRMYSILKGEPLDESAEETSLNEFDAGLTRPGKDPREVVYNPEVPIETFDFIIIDECHRSIYNLWKQVLDYFDAFLIGLTATPDSRTFGFFHENVVSEYSHEDAVADGVNVNYDTYLIETEITQQGSQIAAQEYVDYRHRLTRQKRWAQLDEDTSYSGKQLDRDVVNESTIRQVIRTFQEKLRTELFPHRQEVPKTLIFAKSDSHADDIIRIVRREFGEGNTFCKKVTYRNEEESPSEVLQQFRTAFYPRVAVTVDMIATGTDVKAIECLLFMRDVKSRSYFEQMKGRGTRTLGRDDLCKVTPSAATNKTHFVIVDAVGVSKTTKTDSRPLERKRSVAFGDLLKQVMLGGHDEDTLTSLASRLTRLNQQIDPNERQQFTQLSGQDLPTVTKALLNAYNPDQVREVAGQQLPNTQEPSPEDLQVAQQQMIVEATQVFDDPQVRNFLENVRRSYEQIMDTVNLDTVTFAGFGEQAQEQAKQTVQRFQEFLEENKDTITALKIFYDQPYRRRELTYRMIRELHDALQQPPQALSTERLWQAYQQVSPQQVSATTAQRQLTDLIALIRFALNLTDTLRPFDETVNRNFRDWVFQKQAGKLKFTAEQMAWLHLIKDHIATSWHVEREDFDYAPFDAQGGLGKLWDLFGEDTDEMLAEMNKALVA
ncbi:MAG: type I restriction-modification enzyme R subunit C-terminal domain-containing protein [Bacteroidota bacterium]